MSAAATTHGWRKAKLEDLVFFQRGFDITQAQQKPGSIPVISSSGITSYHNEFKVRAPGVVIGRKGTLGSIHYTAVDYWPHDTTLWSKDFKGNNPRFAYYFLHTLDFKRFDVGNSNPTLNRNHIHDLPVRIPPHPVQAEIADALSAYDDLIENNRRRMALLEESARLLYREWFVRLRFPGHEHARIVDGLPDGWQRAPLGKITTKIGSGATPRGGEASYFSEGITLIRSLNVYDDRFDDDGLAFIGEDQAAALDNVTVESRDILLNITGASVARCCMAPERYLPARVNQHVMIIRVDGTEANPFFVHAAINSDERKRQLLSYAQKGSTREALTKDMMAAFEITLPSKTLMEQFGENAATSFLQRENLALQNQKLKAARDLLLPRLMNGEITV
ncbi:MAG: restriction endonuclease subunit S [Acidobacteriota bacterium]